MVRIIILLIFSIFSFSVSAAEVVDGDTIKLNDETYRLEGIDAPEHGQKCLSTNGKTWACGKAATSELKSFIGRKTVKCVGGVRDDFGRLIATCSVEGKDLGEHMVKNGFAWAFIRYSQTYVAEEKQARTKKIGVWQADNKAPWIYRSEKWEVAAQKSPDGCPIKGNISKNGMIYHAPWSPWYSRTKISLNKGERWFCSEGEAIVAGWRAPLWGN